MQQYAKSGRAVRKISCVESGEKEFIFYLHVCWPTEDIVSFNYQRKRQTARGRRFFIIIIII